MANAPLPQTTPAADKFSFDKKTSKGLTLLSLRGTVDHAFEGRKIAGSIATKKIILDMREVRRFASWGMSEWMDFLRMSSAKDVYLVECSTYAVSQLNLVTGLLGTAKLVSFYASYRCASCAVEDQTLFLIPRDREVIRTLPGSTQDCRMCGGLAQLEEYPAAFFDTIANRPAFDVDDEVLAYLRNTFAYDLKQDVTRLRARRRVEKNFTYVRLSGNLAMIPPEPIANAVHGTTVIDLKEATFDPRQFLPWRDLMKVVLPKVGALQLVDTPPGFLAQAVTTADLHDKVKIRTLQLVYDCARCHTQSVNTVDVADHLEELVTGTAPAAICPGCKASVLASINLEEANRLRALPARDKDPALDKFLTKARKEPLDKLEDCMSLAPASATAAKAVGRGVYVAIGLSTLVIVALVGVLVFKKPPTQTANANPATDPGSAGATNPNPNTNPNTPPKPDINRPDWVMFDTPSAGYCHDMINRLMCVGVSSFKGSRDEAVVEATNVALEELVNSVGLKISDATFKAGVLPAFSEVRSKALSALQAAQIDRSAAAFAAVDKEVTAARKRVVEVLTASGGAAVPAQRSDWYWEEYAAQQGTGTEFKVFIRYDVTVDAIKNLVEKYSATPQVLGATTATAFPGLAWIDPEFTGGAVLVKSRGPFAEVGLADNDIVTAVGDQRVADTAGLQRRIDDWKKGSGDLKLAVKAIKAKAKVVEVPRAKIH